MAGTASKVIILVFSRHLLWLKCHTFPYPINIKSPVWTGLTTHTHFQMAEETSSFPLWSMLSRFCCGGSDVFHSCIFEALPYTGDKSGSHLWPETKDRNKSSAQASRKPQTTLSNPTLYTCFTLLLLRDESSPILRGPSERQHGTVAMLQLGCHGNLGVIDAPALCCRLGNVLVFILPPFCGAIIHHPARSNMLVPHQQHGH